MAYDKLHYQYARYGDRQNRLPKGSVKFMKVYSASLHCRSARLGDERSNNRGNTSFDVKFNVLNLYCIYVFYCTPGALRMPLISLLLAWPKKKVEYPSKRKYRRLRLTVCCFKLPIWIERKCMYITTVVRALFRVKWLNEFIIAGL